MTDSPLLENLNPPQRQAVTTTEGPVLVIAGAGSGKTRVITHRISYLISEKGVAPWEIFAATFTNKAAREMKNRVARLCGAADTERLAIGTFHSHCARILRSEAEHAGLTSSYSICDATDQIALLRSCIVDLDLDPKVVRPRDVREVISLAKMALLDGAPAMQYIAQARDESQANIYELYQRRLRESDAVDFDDLLLLIVRMWSENAEVLAKYQQRFHYVLVDEYQDTNLAQFELVRLLAQDHGNLCVVGDEDQSIYSWRGAEIANLIDFQEHFPGALTIRLEQNYRSTRNILAAATAVISRNTQRLGKTLWTDGDDGDPIIRIEAQSDHSEAHEIAGQIVRLRSEGTPLEEIALFYRVNALSRVYEEALREAKIPYRVIGGVRFYDRAEIKDVLAYLQIALRPGNTLALLRIINQPRRGIGKAAQSKLLTYSEANGISLFETLRSKEHVGKAGVKGRGASGAAALAALIETAIERAPKDSIRTLTEWILEETGYEEALGDPRAIEVLSRKENIQEFLGALDEYAEQHPEAGLGDYLEDIALRSNEDETEEEAGVSLMTVHSAKGLEFDVVFIVAAERDLFPNARAVRDQGHSEEERRLFYVALTRARKRVYVSHANSRRLYGQPDWPAPSIFLREIPKELQVRLRDADLAPLAERESVGGKTAPPPPPTREQQRFRHELLGEVIIVKELGSGADKRFVVRDASGDEHTVLAAYASLKRVEDAPPAQDDSDEMPF